MLSQNLTTLVNGSSLACLPFTLPSNRSFEYQARFLSSGPDAAIELTAIATRAYINGVPCAENAFTAFVDAYQVPLRDAWLELSRATSDIVVLTGRWHMAQVGRGVFDGFVVHVVDAQGNIRSMPYQMEIFNHDYHQSAMTFAARGEINRVTLAELRACTDNLTSRLGNQLTAFGVPHSDGVAWLPDDPTLPVIFDHVEWLPGLERRLLDQTLELDPKGFRAKLVEQVRGPIKLDDLMRVTREPIYVFQMEVKPGKQYDPSIAYYSDEQAEFYGEVRLFEASPVEGVQFASDWQSRGGLRYRIMV